MPRVLIPTDDREIVPSLVDGYRHLGYEVVTGTRNFFLRACGYDLIHFLWPEELTAWHVPTPQKLEQIRETFAWWKSRSRTLISVNNLYPHGHEGNLEFKRLYEIFYSCCETILHHSHASLRLVNGEFPLSAKRRNVVATMFNYDRYLPATLDRDLARNSFGFHNDEFVILIFGALRKSDEVKLIKRAYLNARIPQKRLLMAGRCVGGPSGLQRRWNAFGWHVWLKTNRAVSVSTYILEEDVHRYCEAADVIVVPRLNDLSSGLVGLGATFGRLIVAPNHGSFPDYLEGTDNLLYESGNPGSLAEAIEKASQMDREAVGRKNRALADAWTWERILQKALLPDHKPSTVAAGFAG
jgi:hypothetical protein